MRYTRTRLFLVHYRPFGAPSVMWAVIVRAADAYAAMDNVHRRFGKDKTCSVVRFR